MCFCCRFFTENYFLFNQGGVGTLIGLGGRFASRHLAVDYGAIIPVFPEMGGFVVMPWLGITVPFGNN
jgi:hypothetical protein